MFRLIGTHLDNRQRLLIVLVGFLLLEAALWTPRPEQIVWSIAAAIWVIASTAVSHATLRELGLSADGWARSSWIAGAAAGAALLILLCAAVLGTLHPLFGLAPQFPHALLYGVWALQQEFILQCFFFVNLREVFGTRTAALMSAAAFSFVHIPNPVLVITTFALGITLIAAFAHYRNLYVLAIAHALLGLAVAIAVPDDTHRHMRVGLSWYSYKPSAKAVDATRTLRIAPPTASATQIVR